MLESLIMNRADFDSRRRKLIEEHEELITRPNTKTQTGNGIFDRYLNPVLTAAHARGHRHGRETAGLCDEHSRRPAAFLRLRRATARANHSEP